MAHSNAISHVYELFISSTICKCHIVLKWPFLYQIFLAHISPCQIFIATATTTATTTTTTTSTTTATTITTTTATTTTTTSTTTTTTTTAATPTITTPDFRSLKPLSKMTSDQNESLPL